MIKIEGRVRNLQIEDSKIFPFRNIEKQAASTAMVGALTASSSLATNAPIMMMAARGEDAKSFTCEVGDYRLIGQFTTVQFKNGDELVWVIGVEKEQGRHLVYATLDPKTGLLHMINEMGRSLKCGYISIIKTAFGVSLFFLIFINFIVLITWFVSEDGLGFSLFEYILPLVLAPFTFTFTFLFVLSTFLFSRDQKQACRLSEQVFAVLGFEDVKNQDFRANNFFTDDQGKLRRSVMYYRKNLKGQDPYPEDYFDKK
ncbi:putative type VI secretion system effector [Acinetobacter haemolyticus]|uniref:putative type VI secretion system effector n=1 Tax=Acinetobacter haemolyticus TaxID=29430 RepID=UPI003F57A720